VYARCYHSSNVFIFFAPILFNRDEGVRYERAYCSFESLATLEPFGHVDNYLILCYCRKLFLDNHPSKSKKHYFFSYVGVIFYRLFLLLLLVTSSLSHYLFRFWSCIFFGKTHQETILRYNGHNGEIVQTAFEGANSAFCLWRSDQVLSSLHNVNPNIIL
jgi:hypothetical protein